MDQKKITIDEVYAAIAMAMHEHEGNNIHDVESGKLTIKNVQTLWNAKTRSMRELPQRK